MSNRCNSYRFGMENAYVMGKKGERDGRDNDIRRRPVVAAEQSDPAAVVAAENEIYHARTRVVRASGS